MLIVVVVVVEVRTKLKKSALHILGTFSLRLFTIEPLYIIVFKYT